MMFMRQGDGVTGQGGVTPSSSRPFRRPPDGLATPLTHAAGATGCTSERIQPEAPSACASRRFQGMSRRSLVVIESFHENPEAIRELALSLEYRQLGSRQGR